MPGLSFSSQVYIPISPFFHVWGQRAISASNFPVPRCLILTILFPDIETGHSFKGISHS